MASGQTRGWPVLGGLALALTLSLSCGGGGDPVTIDWDLSESHTKADIGEEPDPKTKSYGLRSVESLRVALPGDRVFAADDVQDIRIVAGEENLETIFVVLDPRTAEEAHERATAIAEKWDLSRRNLDRWREDVQAARASGEREADVGGALATDGVVEPVPFSPSVEIQYSFDDEKPWVVAFHMYWNPNAERNREG
ncbi:MAG: hypothetical protein ACRDV9_03140 [Acidimicrobiia bacterium]